MKIWVLTSILMFAASAQTLPLCAQALALFQLEHKSWAAADGAPAHIYDMVEDDDGILWLSALDGLYRFDGLRFTAFSPSTGSPALRQYVYSFYKARDGAIWGASGIEGVICIRHGRATRFGTAQGLPSDRVDALAQTPDGTMWVAGGDLYSFNGRRWQRDRADNGLPAGQVGANYVDHAGTQWAITADSVYYRSSGETTFHATSEHWSKDNAPISMAEGPQGDLWIALSFNNNLRSVVRQLNVPGHPAPAPLSFSFPHTIWDARFDTRGALWVTGDGLDRITFSTGVATPDRRPRLTGRQEHLGAQGWSSGETHAIFEDKERDLWVSTLHGLERLRVPMLVKAIDSSGSRPDLAPGNAGNVLVGVEHSPLLSNQGAVSQVVGPAADIYYCMLQDREGDIWFDDKKALKRIHNGAVATIPLPAGVLAISIRQIVELPDHSMAFLFLGGSLRRLSGSNWTTMGVAASSADPVNILSLDSHGTLWTGYASGRMSAGNRIIAAVDAANASIHAFLEIPEGMLAGDESGLMLVSDGKAQRIRFADNLRLSNLSGMVLSANGDLWLNGGHGIIRVARTEYQAAFAVPRDHVVQGEMYTEDDLHGPAPLLYDMPTVARDATGRLWFNTSDSIVYLDSKDLVQRHVLPTLSLLSVEADGHLLAPEITRIPPRTATIRIAYFGSNLTAPERVTYKYRLSGLEKTWQDVGPRTEAVYTRLLPGHYKFEVIASNGDGRWTQPAKISLYVVPAFYQRMWFVLLLGVAFLALLWMAYRMRVRSITRRLHERAEERANERVSIARDLHDTLLQGIHGLMLSFHVAVKHVPAEGRAREQLESALIKADRLIVEGRDRVSRLRSESLKEMTLRGALEGFGADLNQGEFPTYEVVVRNHEFALDCHVSEELFFIAREALTNSFNHAHATSICVILDFRRRELCLVCQDDGCGMDLDHLVSPSGHYGLVGMRERSDRLGATFHCTSSPGQGTKISVSLPCHLAAADGGSRSWLARMGLWTPLSSER